MTTSLKRYVRPLMAREVEDIIRGKASVEAVDVGSAVDLSNVNATIGRLTANGGSRPRRAERAAWDAEMVEGLHRAMADLPRRLKLDMRLWHWLTTEIFQDFVLRRWANLSAVDDSSGIAPNVSARFVGSASLVGVSRNALARIFWCGETLWEGGEYGLAQKALRRQDLFQGVFERKVGLYPPAARAAVRFLDKVDEDLARAALRLLNHYLTTTAVEWLLEEKVEAMLAEILEAIRD